MSVPHPTEQYGQTLGTTLACLIRSSCALATAGARLAPSPARPPSAVPVRVPADCFRKSRRDWFMTSPQGDDAAVRRAFGSCPSLIGRAPARGAGVLTVEPHRDRLLGQGVLRHPLQRSVTGPNEGNRRPLPGPKGDAGSPR